MIQSINFKKISDLLAERSQNMERGNNAKLMVIVEPQKPSIINEQKDWETYLELVGAWREQMSNKSKEIDIAIENIKKIDSLIREFVPSNCWVKVGDVYVGYETCDWPMYVPTLEIVKANCASSLRTLKHKLS